MHPQFFLAAAKMLAGPCLCLCGIFCIRNEVKYHFWSFDRAVFFLLGLMLQTQPSLPFPSHEVVHPFSREAPLPPVFSTWTGDLTMEIIGAVLLFQNIIYKNKFYCKVLEYPMNNNSFTVITSLVPGV